MKRFALLMVLVLIMSMMLQFEGGVARAEGSIPYYDPQSNVMHDKDLGDVTVLDQAEMTTLGGKLTAGWYLVRGEVSRTALNTDVGAISITGEVHLILENGCNLSLVIDTYSETAGIRVSGEGNRLVIWGQTNGKDVTGNTGKLTVTSSISYGALIGGAKSGETCSDVTINGGNIDLQGTSGQSTAAGIGGASGGHGGNVTIHGGSVNINHECNYGAGIGGGRDGKGGRLEVTGGTLISKSSIVGIGGGAGSSGKGGDGGEVIISGGKVLAASTSVGAGIGGGNGFYPSVAGDGGTVTITGGEVEVIGMSVGIGGGNKMGSITIGPNARLKVTPGYGCTAIGLSTYGAEPAYSVSMGTESAGKRLLTFTAINRGDGDQLILSDPPNLQWQSYFGGAWVNVPGATGTTYSAPSPSGKYRCVIAQGDKVTQGDQYYGVFTNELYTGTATAKYPTPALTIDYANEKLAGGDAGMTYSVTPTGGSAAAVTADTNGKLTIGSGWFGKTASVVQNAWGNINVSDAQTGLVIPARPDAPSGLSAGYVSASGATDGKIKGLTVGAAYQYRLSSATAYTNANASSDGEITGLGEGSYVVRTPATASAFASADSAAVTISVRPTISIGTQPASVTVTQGSISGSLSIAATVSEGSTTYQWYSNSSASNSNGAAIGGETSASFTIPTTLMAGAHHYYCVVSATNADSVASNAATVTVNAKPSPPAPDPTPIPGPTPDPNMAQPEPVVDPVQVEVVDPVESEAGYDKDIPVRAMAAGSTIYVDVNIRDADDTVVLTLPNVPVELQEIVSKSVTARASEGVAHIALTSDQLGTLPVGKYSMWLESSGDTLNNPILETLIGRFAIGRRTPVAVGNNAPRVLPGMKFDAAFAVELSGLGKVTAVEMTLSCAGQTATARRVGDGELCFTLPLQLTTPGDCPVTVTAAESAQTLPMDETVVGSVMVVDVSRYLSGDLRPVLGESYLYGKATEQVPVAFQGERASLDQGASLLTAVSGDALKIGIKYSGSGAVSGYLTRVRNNPFAAKDARATPSKLMLKAAKTQQSKAKKAAVFSFDAQDMGRLKPGYYQFVAKGKEIGELTMATILIVDGDQTPEDWTMPRTLKVSVGQAYQLVRSVPIGHALPSLAVKSSNKKVATISTDGVLSAKKTGATTITVAGPSGARMKCKVTVVSNSWRRSKPLYVKNKTSLFASTKRLYYKGGELKAEVFVYNRTGKKLTAATGWTFELYQGEALIYQRPIDPVTLKKALKHKQYRAYSFSITEAQLPGISAKSFDLATGQIQAVIRGADITPLAGGHIGVAQAKSIEAQDAGDIAPVVPAA